MIDPHNIFKKRLDSVNEAERMVAVNKVHESLKKGGGHPDDWEVLKKSIASKSDSDARPRQAEADADAEMAEMPRKNEADKRKQAKAITAKERKAREKVDAENAELREQPKQAKVKPVAPDPTYCVGLGSGLLPRATVNKLSAEQIAERMRTLFVERGAREYNLTAQVDLVIGQLTQALYQRHATLFGKRKRGSNAPTVSEFLETHAGTSASWCRRCFKAYGIVTTAGWDGDTTGGIEGIIKAAADPNRTTVKRVSKVQRRLDALTDVVRRKEWEHAERMVNDWALG
jgi:hypothetical protein